MRLQTKVIAAMRHRPSAARAFAPAVGAHPDTVLLQFATSEDCQVALQGHKGLTRTKLGLNKDFTPTQQARKSELRPLFKEAKVVGNRTF
jgi:hypothetical protein